MPNKTKSGKNQEGYFICGTIGELTIEGCPHGRCTFELMPEEQMKTLRNECEGYLWLPSDVDARGVGRAVTRYGKVAHIDFSRNHERFLRLLIAAKVNALKIRVESRNVAPEKTAAKCECKCSAHLQKCAHTEENGQYPQACVISLM